MLANGAKLGYKEKGSSSYTDLPGLKEIPDMGLEPEKVENTCLSDKNKQYENGIGDAGDLTYKFKYDNTMSDSPYRIMRKAQEEGKTLSFQETLVDGTKTEFDAQVSVKRTGGGVNGVIEFNLAMSVQSDLVITDPDESV
ncbi:phage tail tube protein [Clostridium sp. AM58-1XD]|uniref:phage tail tube protein n=1 Tax=Clostridium sp. AM58-1XD TaxID=2292307 RepID=UPI000E4CD238|nr:phage tail tube protein [Clostridium sp. AM58-1XD]RGY95226.1 phage tail protein [Clostridium sp. AM58-1XD]